MIIESGNLLEFDSRRSKHISIEASTIEHIDFGRARSKHILLSSSIVEHVFSDEHGQNVPSVGRDGRKKTARISTIPCSQVGFERKLLEKRL